MAKSELMRPIWVCMKLCDSDTIATGMLGEIMYRSNVTHYTNGDNRVIVFSLREWSDNTGFSVKQVRKALERLKGLNLIKVYNKKHPHKTVLRALHVEVSHELWELWSCLTSRGYKFDGEILRPKPDYMNFSLSVAKCGHMEMPDMGHTEMSNMGLATMPSDDMAVCPEGADPTIYNKKDSNDTIMAAAHNCATASGQNQAEVSKKVEKKEGNVENDKKDDDGYEIPDSLKVIKTLPALLIALHHHYLKYFWGYSDEVISDDLDSIKLWIDRAEKLYGEEVTKVRDDTFVGLFILLRKELGDKVPPLIDKVISNWGLFTQHVKKHYGLPKVPQTPTVEFFYYFRHCAMNLNVQQGNEKSIAA